MGMDRKNIDDKYKWNIDLMYSNKESIEKDIEKVKSLCCHQMELMISERLMCDGSRRQESMCVWVAENQTIQ